ncbi:unnamed protein product [Ixodes hexagonus]
MMKKFRETDWESFEAFTIEQNRKRKQPRGASGMRGAVNERIDTSSEEIEMVEDHQTEADLADFKTVTYKKPKAKQPKTATKVEQYKKPQQTNVQMNKKASQRLLPPSIKCRYKNPRKWTSVQQKEEQRCPQLVANQRCRQ